jgi:hypothetical protein
MISIILATMHRVVIIHLFALRWMSKVEIMLHLKARIAFGELRKAYLNFFQLSAILCNYLQFYASTVQGSES